MEKKKPNIEIDMKDIKKVMKISIPIVAVLIVVIAIFAITKGGGGGNEPQVNPATESAKVAMQQNQKDKALEILYEGQTNGGLDEEGVELITQLKTELFSKYLTDAQKEEKNGQYEDAAEKYAKAIMAAPEGEDIGTLEDSVNRNEEAAKGHARLQKDFTAYVETFQQALSDSNQLLNEFKVQLDGLETGKVTPEQFVTTEKGKISDSSAIIADLDMGLFIQDQSLLDLHKNVITHVNYQHDMYLKSLEINNENKKEMIDTLKSDFLKLKQEQVSLIQVMNQFAEDNDLELNLEIKSKDK